MNNTFKRARAKLFILIWSLLLLVGFSPAASALTEIKVGGYKLALLKGTVNSVNENSRGYVTGTVSLSLLPATDKPRALTSVTLPYMAYTDEFEGGSLFSVIWPPPNLVRNREIVALVVLPKLKSGGDEHSIEKVKSIIVVPTSAPSAVWSVASLNDAKQLFSQANRAASSELRRIGYMQALKVSKESPSAALAIVDYIQHLAELNANSTTFEIPLSSLPRWYRVFVEGDSFYWETRDRDLVLKCIVVEMLRNSSPLAPQAIRWFKRLLKSETKDQIKGALEELTTAADDLGVDKRRVVDQALAGED